MSLIIERIKFPLNKISDYLTNAMLELFEASASTCSPTLTLPFNKLPADFTLKLQINSI